MEDTSEGTTSSSVSVSKEDTRNTIGDSTIDSGKIFHSADAKLYYISQYAKPKSLTGK